MKILVGVAIFVCSMATTFGQGTIQFLNSALSRLTYQDAIGGPILVLPAGIHVGVFWGTDAAGGSVIVGMGRGTLALPTATTIEGGIWNGGVVYPIPGTQEGQRIWMKIAAWANGSNTSTEGATHYGESGVVSVVLGPTAGPGTVVWQGATGTATDRMKPFSLVVLPDIPEPSVIALGSLGLVALLFRMSLRTQRNR